MEFNDELKTKIKNLQGEMRKVNKCLLTHYVRNNPRFTIRFYHQILSFFDEYTQFLAKDKKSEDISKELIAKVNEAIDKTSKASKGDTAEKEVNLDYKEINSTIEEFVNELVKKRFNSKLLQDINEARYSFDRLYGIVNVLFSMINGD